jgi:hypothetical protein
VLRVVARKGLNRLVRVGVWPDGTLTPGMKSAFDPSMSSPMRHGTATYPIITQTTMPIETVNQNSGVAPCSAPESQI